MSHNAELVNSQGRYASELSPADRDYGKELGLDVYAVETDGELND